MQRFFHILSQRCFLIPRQQEEDEDEDEDKDEDKDEDEDPFHQRAFGLFKYLKKVID